MSNIPQPYTGNDPYIFISYSHKDSETVMKIVSKLSEEGYRVWFDVGGIPLGRDYAEHIANRIDGCSYFITFISGSYVESAFCLDELHFATDSDKNRFLVYLDDAKLSAGLEMRQRRYQNLMLYKYNIDTDGEVWDMLFSANGIDSCLDNANTIKVIGEGMTKISESCFRGSKSFKKIMIAEGVTEIGDYAFADCARLEEVSLPDSLQIIGDSAFEGCNIKEIAIPGSIKKIGIKAFYNCLSLESLQFGGQAPLLKTIGEKAFSWTGLSEIRLPVNLTEIDEAAFAQCKELKAVEFSESLKVIGISAFRGCRKLHSITLPSNLEWIGNNAFSSAGLKEVTLPENLKYIHNEVFRECANLRHITLPKNLCHIGESAFAESALREIKIPDGVISIGRRAFQKCTYMKNATLPNSLRFIGAGAFGGVAFNELIIPDTVQEIDTGAFSNSIQINKLVISTKLYNKCTSKLNNAFEHTVIKSIVFTDRPSNFTFIPEPENTETADIYDDVFKSFNKPQTLNTHPSN